jgi:hypothetical protein
MRGAAPRSAAPLLPTESKQGQLQQHRGNVQTAAAHAEQAQLGQLLQTTEELHASLQEQSEEQPVPVAAKHQSFPTCSQTQSLIIFMHLFCRLIIICLLFVTPFI